MQRFLTLAAMTVVFVSGSILSNAQTTPTPVPNPVNGYAALNAMIAQHAAVATDQANLAALQSQLTADQASQTTLTAAFVTFLGTCPANSCVVTNADGSTVSLYAVDSTQTLGYRVTAVNILAPPVTPTPVAQTPVASAPIVAATPAAAAKATPKAGAEPTTPPVFHVQVQVTPGPGVVVHEAPKATLKPAPK